ncbi:cysteine sulfinic acid decarboxylase-like [Haliotis cracherodii]|uniref:cysteine sulfinic acid decarboxylase-like n=1 Tax=Haliotis cracherodii TaxID=6455 RepID=UPI0039E7B89F
MYSQFVRSCRGVSAVIENTGHCAFVLKRLKATAATSMSVNPYSDPEIKDFLSKVQEIIVNDVLRDGIDGDKVIDFQQPAKLQELMQLPIGRDPEPTQELLDHCRRVVKYSVKTANPRFYNQLYSGVNPHSLAGAWMTDALNTNIHTYEVCPVFVVMEKYLMQKICGIIGYPNGDGVMCPGGSFSNILANHLARYKRCPEVKTKGMTGVPKMKIFTSNEAHYSLQKSASFLGFGTDSLVSVETDEKGKMRVDDLENKIKVTEGEGSIPLFVMATSGTTVLGAYDDLPAIADVCEKHGVWMHVDGAWGGGVLLTDQYKHLMAGVERSHSVAWNFHKMSGIQLQCSVLVVQEKGLLEKCNRGNAEYLFQQDKNYDPTFDIGDKTIQCGRKVDAMKLWLAWKAMGDKGMADRVIRAFDNSRYLAQRLRETEGFRLIMPEFECTNVGFWYIPPSLRGQEETPEWWQKVGKVAPKIKQRMMENGSMMIGYTPLSVKGFVNFFRIIITNSLQDSAEMDRVLEEIEKLGKDL